MILTATATHTTAHAPLADTEMAKLDAYWRAANYLSVGQIYLLDNPLLRRPLMREDVKPRLLGHWGTTPGLNFIYAHLNRVIRARDLSMIYLAGPGHGGPALFANTYLEGTYSEVYPDVSEDERGMRRLFKQFSFPGGVPSHVAPELPGSIHEGGELGYVLSHAFGAAFDNPDLVVACVVGDGEAETGPLAASWHSNKFLNPAHDGAVLPILHLNEYKIAGPTVLARIPAEELVGPVAEQPSLERLDVFRAGRQVVERNLVRAPVALGRLAVDLPRAGPPLRRAQHDHGPARAVRLAGGARPLLDPRDLVERGVERRGHAPVHELRIGALDEMWLPAVAGQQALELLGLDPIEHRGIGDLVAVQVQDG